MPRCLRFAITMAVGVATFGLVAATELAERFELIPIRWPGSRERRRRR